MREPWQRRVLYAAGGAGKVAYFGACVALFLSGAGRSMLLTFGIIDLLVAGFFAHVLWHDRAGQPTVD